MVLADGRCRVTWLPNFLGCIDFLAMGLYPRGRFACVWSSAKNRLKWIINKLHRLYYVRCLYSQATRKLTEFSRFYSLVLALKHSGRRKAICDPWFQLISKLIPRITFNLFTAESNMNLTDQLEPFVRDLHDFIQTLNISYKECFF